MIIAELIVSKVNSLTAHPLHALWRLVRHESVHSQRALRYTGVCVPSYEGLQVKYRSSYNHQNPQSLWRDVLEILVCLELALQERKEL